MRVRLVSLEDGITSSGFRKMAAYVNRIDPQARACYVSTSHNYRSVRNFLWGTLGQNADVVGPPELDEIAEGLADADVIGYSSMTGYADLTREVIKRVRKMNPDAYQIWGGIHPIIQPEDAILADVDAICVGEGEFAFEEFFDAYRNERDYTKTKNFWFKHDGEVIQNHFRPLMTRQEMEDLPYPQYGDDRELIYRKGKGFVEMKLGDYVANHGLGYTTLWSIGCPFHCTYCGNTKFIANDPLYKRIRHPSARYIVEEVKAAKRRFPHLSQVSFHDDSFMAIPYKELEEFAELWKEEVNLPFAVYGVIPNYVKQPKFEILTWAGMNRIRMGLQSGSQRILDFYKRPSPPHKIAAAGKVASSFAPKYHIPPAYDLIMDNPIETRQDVLDTLELLYEMDRPYTLLIYSLKVIPNTGLEQSLKDMGIDLDEIDRTYMSIPPRWANLMLYILAFGKPPRWIWKLLMKNVRASTEPQKLYPRLGLILRAAYLTRHVLHHVRVFDYSITPGWSGYVLWRLGLVDWWRRNMTARLPKPLPPPERPLKKAPTTAASSSESELAA